MLFFSENTIASRSNMPHSKPSSDVPLSDTSKIIRSGEKNRSLPAQVTRSTERSALRTAAHLNGGANLMPVSTQRE